MGDGCTSDHGAVTWTCPRCGFSLPVRVWPVLCSCGFRQAEDGTVISLARLAPIRAAILPLAAICLACPFFRQHPRAGGRCTHRRCGCQGDERGEPVELSGVRFSQALVNLMRRGRCPAGKW